MAQCEHSPCDCGRRVPAGPDDASVFLWLWPVLFRVVSDFSWSVFSSGFQASRELMLSGEGFVI